MGRRHIFRTAGKGNDKRAAVGGAMLLTGLMISRWLVTGRRARRHLSHVSDPVQAYLGARTRIVIVGGGFAGLAAARTLGRYLRDGGDGEDGEGGDGRDGEGGDDVSVLVVDRNNSLLFAPLLWTVANGRSDPNDVVVPIRIFQRRRPFHVLHAEVERIDLDRRVVETDAGARRYDTLVIAAGSVTVMPGLPGLYEHALMFHTPADAMQLRNRLIDAVEAAHNAQDLYPRGTRRRGVCRYGRWRPGQRHLPLGDVCIWGRAVAALH